MKKLTQLGAFAIGAVVLAGALLLALPFIPLLLAYNYIDEQRFKQKYRRFLREANGAAFFCYNNRRSSVAFAREVVVPALDASVRIVFVEGKAIKADADQAFISHMLYSIKERRGFPYLLKIVDEQVLAYSVNNQFYSCLVQQKPLLPLLATIQAFYHSPARFLSK